jgi:hypothetical protein
MEVISTTGTVFENVSQLWEDRRVVICFLRQFGCRFCKQQIAGLNKLHKQLGAHDITLIAIGLGTQSEAKDFQVKTNFRGELYVIPNAREDEPSLYKQFGLANLGTLKPGGGGMGHGPLGLREEVYLAGQAAIEEGFEDDPSDRWTGSTKQVGGVFVMGPGNSCDFSHRSAFAGDHADLSDVLTAATGTRPDGGDFMYPSTQLWSDRLLLNQLVLPSPRSQLRSTFRLTTKTSRVALVVSALFASAASVAVLSIGFVPGSLQLWLFTGIIIIASAYWWRQTGAISNPSQVSKVTSSTKKAEEVADIMLYTPRSVDEIAVNAGAVECDCSFIAQTDMVSVVEQVDKVNSNADGSTSSTIPAAQQSSKSSTSPLLPRLGGACPFAPTELAEYQAASCYFREFLAKGHPQLGRRGPTCPFVPLALKKNSLYMGVVRAPAFSGTGECARHTMSSGVEGKETTAEQVEQVARRFIERFFELTPSDGKLALYKVGRRSSILQ